MSLRFDRESADASVEEEASVDWAFRFRGVNGLPSQELFPFAVRTNANRLTTRVSGRPGGSREQPLAAKAVKRSLTATPDPQV